MLCGTRTTSPRSAARPDQEATRSPATGEPGEGATEAAYPRDDSAATTRSYGAGPRNGLGRTSRWGGTVGVRSGRQRFLTISRIRSAVSDGVLPTLTPTASRASFLACAVPEEPETMAPAWPMVLPSGAVNPAT